MLSSIDNLALEWMQNEHVVIVTALYDVDNPMPCNQWGELGVQDVPIIIDDYNGAAFNMFGWFQGNSGYFPSTAIINHQMEVAYKDVGYSGYPDWDNNINNVIEGLLDDMGDLAVYIIIEASYSIFTSVDSDGDGVINPGDGFIVSYDLENTSPHTDSYDVTGNFIFNENEEEYFELSMNAIDFGNIPFGESANQSVEIITTQDIPMGSYDITTQINAKYTNILGEEIEYKKDIVISFEVSINQYGFPYFLTNQSRASLLLLDIDNNGTNEIIFGDDNGIIHIINQDGTEFSSDIFPYESSGSPNDIWGSASGDDLDGDGNLDFVIGSKNKHLYIFDQNGLKTNYIANKYITSTPTIGNMDDDDDLEVVFAGYQSSNKLFAINHDGTDVEGFPITIGEKVKASVSLADFDGNGKDDIVFGTDDDNIYLYMDDGTVAEGFPFTTGDKVQSDPAILNLNGEMIILCGSNDDMLYAINSDGSLRFTVETGNKVLTSPSFVEYNSQLYIFFGSDDGNVYAVNQYGAPHYGWPRSIGSAIGGSVVFADLNNDGEPEVVISTELGEIIVYDLYGELFAPFPIVNEYSFLGSPMVMDIDGDNDLEILAGSSGNISVIDIKEEGSAENLWSVFKGNNRRSGYYVAGDILSNDLGDMPREFKLHSIYPNPFNATTHIEYEIPEIATIDLSIYDLQGRKVDIIYSGIKKPGLHHANWNADSFSSGVYLLKMLVISDVDLINSQYVKKLLLIK